MYAKLYSSSVLGIDGYIVEVEVDISNGLPVFESGGLARPRYGNPGSGFAPLSRTVTVNSLCNGSRPIWPRRI